MGNKFWKWAALYLVIGIFWGAFNVQKGLEAGNYNKDNARIAGITVLVNTFVWPISAPVGVYRLLTEK